MAGIGNLFAKAALDLALGSGSPASWYAALLTTLPSDGDGTGIVEAAWTGYARQPITNNVTNFPAASVVSHVATKICQAPISWGAVSGLSSGIAVVGVALFDAATGGHLGYVMVFGSLSSPSSYALMNGSAIVFSPGNLTLVEV